MLWRDEPSEGLRMDRIFIRIHFGSFTFQVSPVKEGWGYQQYAHMFFARREKMVLPGSAVVIHAHELSQTAVPLPGTWLVAG